jgi:hypothetical protein
MTDVLDWLTNAMSAAAGTVREQDLRPLTAPERPRRRHQPAWAAPVVAAAAMVLVIGLAVAALDGLFGTRQSGGPGRLPAAPLPLYVTTDLAITRIVVRSTVTGKAVAVVPVTLVGNTGSLVAPALAAGGNGTFYVAAFERRVRRSRSTDSGSPRPGMSRGSRGCRAARCAPAGRRTPWRCRPTARRSRSGPTTIYYPSHVSRGLEQSDQVLVVNTYTGAQRIWRGGSLAEAYNFFRVASLSWTGDLRELAVLGEWCRAIDPNPGGEGRGS